VVFSKGAKAIRECEEEIKDKKDAMKLKGVGKGIATYIEELITTGSIQKLEELRAGTA
jgi:DNA polymerase/3'-5' exonuclease PolX